MSNPKKPVGPAPPKRPPAAAWGPGAGSGGGFVTEYVHYRTGKLMVARAYGYNAWPFGYGRRG